MFQAYNALPTHLKFDPTRWQELRPYDLLNIIFVSLEYLYSNFLLARVLRHVNISENPELVLAAKSILDRIIFLHTHRDRMADMRLFIPWAVPFFGVPSAAILAIDLLLRHRAQSGPATPKPAAYSRSEIIQNLSVFAGCLNEISPSEGSFLICERMAIAIRKILDQILEPSIAMPPTPGSQPPQAFPTGSDVDTMSFLDPASDLEFSQWLNTLDTAQIPGLGALMEPNGSALF